MTHATLPPPSRDLALRLTNASLGANCIQGQEFSLRKGTQSVDIRCLKEAVAFLDKCRQYESPDQASHPSVTICYLDLAALRDWVSDILGDAELARAIANEIGEGYRNSANLEERGKHFRIHGPHVKGLMARRLRQCEVLLECR